MARTVQCIKLGKEAEGLDFAPYPGDLGKRIYENVSKEAWAGWLKHQTRFWMMCTLRRCPITKSTIWKNCLRLSA